MFLKLFKTHKLCIKRFPVFTFCRVVADPWYSGLSIPLQYILTVRLNEIVVEEKLLVKQFEHLNTIHMSLSLNEEVK